VSFKNLFLQNHWTNFKQIGTNHPWRERIQVSLKEGDSSSSRGDNSKKNKITQKILKNLFLQN
jgi:hypothetical protein